MKKYDGFALITGGSSGIGLAFAHQLAAKGYDLVLVGRKLEKLEAAARAIKQKYPVFILTISQDLTMPDAVDAIFDLLKKRKIHVGLLVSNAGSGDFGYFHEIDHGKTLDMIKVMCLGYADLIHKFLPPMLDRKSGGVILMSSLAALPPGPLTAVYAACKAFSLQLGISLHAEYGGKGIDILTVCPGSIDTPFFDNLEDKRVRLLLDTFKPPEEVAEKALKALGKDIVVTLPSDLSQRSAYLTPFMPHKLTEKIMKLMFKHKAKIEL